MAPTQMRTGHYITLTSATAAKTETQTGRPVHGGAPSRLPAGRSLHGLFPDVKVAVCYAEAISR